MGGVQPARGRRSLRGSELADEVVPPLAVSTGPHGKAAGLGQQGAVPALGTVPGKLAGVIVLVPVGPPPAFALLLVVEAQPDGLRALVVGDDLAQGGRLLGLLHPHQVGSRVAALALCLCLVPGAELAEIPEAAGLVVGPALGAVEQEPGACGDLQDRRAAQQQEGTPGHCHHPPRFWEVSPAKRRSEGITASCESLGQERSCPL